MAEIQHKGWDWNAVRPGTWNEISEEFCPVALDWIGKYRSVLDIGTGRGRHALFFAEHGFQVRGIDLSESSVAFVRKQMEERGIDGMEVALGDMTELPYGRECFDCAICFHTIYHTNYDGVRRALQEIHRVLRDGGEAFITFNAKDHPCYDKEKSVDGFTMVKEEGLEEGIPHCYVDENDLFALLGDFDILSMNKISDYVRKGREAHGVHYYVHVAKK